MNKKNKIIIISLFFIIGLGIASILIYKNTNAYKLNKDIRLFNKLTIDNIDKNICGKILDKQIKEKCFDNYYSLNAFNKENENECNNIVNQELKELCKKEILKFKN